MFGCHHKVTEVLGGKAHQEHSTRVLSRSPAPGTCPVLGSGRARGCACPSVPRRSSSSPGGHRILPTDGPESRAIAMNSEQGAQWWNRNGRTLTIDPSVAQVGGCMGTDSQSLTVRESFPRSV